MGQPIHIITSTVEKAFCHERQGLSKDCEVPSA